MQNTNNTPRFSSLKSALEAVGKNPNIASAERVSGGDINKAYSVTLEGGARVFMKANAKSNLPFFLAEAAGLSAIASCGKIATPKILAVGTDDGESEGYSFLLLEFIQSARPTTDYWKELGKSLAALHNADCSRFVENAKYGFFQDNFIGRTEQKNPPTSSWIEFFREARLLPQLALAQKYFDKAFVEKTKIFAAKLDTLLIEPEKPSLIHGDLWRGNVFCGNDGAPMLIDPAAYVGAAEADLAMTELFGGFPRDFYDAYWRANPKISGYEKRRDIYNLYHLLNHLNMFGASYLHPVKEIIDSYC